MYTKLTAVAKTVANTYEHHWHVLCSPLLTRDAQGAVTTGNPFFMDKITWIQYREGFGGSKGVKYIKLSQSRRGTLQWSHPTL